MIDTQQISFSAGLPGFPDVRNFVLLNTELAQDPFSILRCVEDEEKIEFVVTTPGSSFRLRTRYRRRNGRALGHQGRRRLFC